MSKNTNKPAGNQGHVPYGPATGVSQPDNPVTHDNNKGEYVTGKGSYSPYGPATGVEHPDNPVTHDNNTGEYYTGDHNPGK